MAIYGLLIEGNPWELLAGPTSIQLSHYMGHAPWFYDPPKKSLHVTKSRVLGRYQGGCGGPGDLTHTTYFILLGLNKLAHNQIYFIWNIFLIVLAIQKNCSGTKNFCSRIKNSYWTFCDGLTASSPSDS